MPAVFVAVPLGAAQGNLPTVSLSPVSATININQSLPFTATVSPISATDSYAGYQWDVNGSEAIAGDISSWAFTPASAGTYSISVTVLGSGSNVTGESQPPITSQTSHVLVTASSQTGSFGYSNVTSSAGAHGEQYLAVGSLFTLDVAANVTSISALIRGQLGVGDSLIYSYGIYDDNDSEIGSFVSQTSQGVLTYVPDLWSTDPYWETLAFSSPVALNPGNYWLMEIDNGSQNIAMFVSGGDVSGFTSGRGFTGGMTFPIQLTSPDYWQNSVYCIFATYTYGPNASPPAQTTSAPSIQLSCTGSSLTSNLFVQISGNLTFNDSGIPGVPVLLTYSVTDGNSWTDLTTVTTDSNGAFLADWTPSATGTYLIRANFTGNSEYPASNTTVSFALAPTETQSVFSVTSNSTISDFAFNSATEQLSFTVSGPSGTTGYVDLSIPKSMLNDTSSLQVKVGNNLVTYTLQSEPDSWLISFHYHHSTHKVTIDFNSSVNPETISLLDEIAIASAAVTAAVCLWATAKVVMRDIRKATATSQNTRIAD